EIDRVARIGDFAGEENLGGFAAAEIENELRREIEAGNGEVRIDAALEAVAGIGMNAERAAGLGDVERVPERALDQHIDGRVGTAGRLAAHDAAERFHTVR